MDLIREKNQLKPSKSAFRTWACVLTHPVRAYKSRKFDPAREARRQADLDKKLVYSLSKSRFPSIKQLKYIGNFLSPKELWLLRASFLIIVLCLVFLGTRFYFSNLKTVPVSGGKYVEGVIGAPKYINPLYASINDVDSDLGKLVYSSLFARDKSNSLVPDLAESYSVSGDGKIYTIKLREGVKWHDGENLEVEDVIFTFNTIKDANYKSPLRQSFAGVEIQRTGDWEFQFLLADPYAAFLDLLTFGIMPSHLWYQIPPESASLHVLNLKPIGSGPFEPEKMIKDSAGNIVEYDLVPNENYYGQVPLIDISFNFYPNYEEAVAAFNNNTIDGISYLPSEFRNKLITPKAIQFHKLQFPQLTIIFLNQEKNPSLKELKVRQALAYSIDRQRIINDILGGDANRIDSPILPNSFAYNDAIKKYEYNPEEAGKLLEEAGWKMAEITSEQVAEAEANLASEDEKKKSEAENIVALGAGMWRQKDGKFLTIKLATVNRVENEAIIDSISSDWQAVGVKAIKDIKTGTQMQEIIKPRDYEALFYGQIIGADPDPYAFWHSSQAGNGFNISNFNSKEADKLLEEARLTNDQAQRLEKYKRFQEIIANEAPAIFMYSPVYVYPQSKAINGFDVNNILLPNDRFANISEWYAKTGKKLIW